MALDGMKGTKLDTKMERVISALLTERSIEDAAKKANIGVHTVYRWFNVPEFDRAYREAKKRIVEHAITQVQHATAEAVETLRNIMRDETNPASSRVSASKTILEQAIKAVEIEDLINRVEELESTISEKSGVFRA